MSPPWTRWRAQPLVRRRLQLLLGSAFAAFAAFLLAVALRGPWVDLFLLMTTGLVVHLIVGAYIGSRELQITQAERARARRRSAVDRMVAAPQGRASVDDLYRRYGIEGDLFSRGFAGDGVELDWAAVRAEGLQASTAAGDVPVPEEARTGEPAADTDGGAGQPSPGEAAATIPRVQRRRRSNRPAKARPIYIEAEDEADFADVRRQARSGA